MIRYPIKTVRTPYLTGDESNDRCLGRSFYAKLWMSLNVGGYILSNDAA